GGARDRSRFLLLLVPPCQSSYPLVLGDACCPPFVQRTQSRRVLPLRLDRAADRRRDLLRADDLARFRTGAGLHRRRLWPALSVLGARRVDSKARLARICAQYAVASSCAPRRQSGISRP